MTAGRHILIGDVHGMTAELRALVDRVAPGPADTLVFAGDLVDKGPDSAGTVAFARGLRDQGLCVVLVLGNHEDRHARYRAATAGGREVRMKGVDELASITEALSEADVAFLDSAVPVHRIPSHDAVVVHGGILPVLHTLDPTDKSVVARLLRVRHVTGVSQARLTVEFELEAGLDEQALDRILAEGRFAEHARSHTVVRRRFRPAGSFVSLGKETEADPFWADVYDGRFGHCYFGHSPFTDATEPVAFPHATGLDLGCVFGGRLAAVVLEQGREPQSVTVEASGRFATSLWED